MEEKKLKKTKTKKLNKEKIITLNFFAGKLKKQNTLQIIIERKSNLT